MYPAKAQSKSRLLVAIIMCRFSGGQFLPLFRRPIHSRYTKEFVDHLVFGNEPTRFSLRLIWRYTLQHEAFEKAALY